MGVLFKGPAVVIYVVGALWTLYLIFAIVEEALGFAVALLSLFVFPILLYLAPLYAILVNGDWSPLLVSYGSTIGAGVLFTIGSMIDRD